MRFMRCRIAFLSVICILISPFAIAEELLVAKVYRDYPGYIEAPSCTNPRLSPSTVKQLAVKEQTSEMLSVEESVPSQRARKAYRDYPGYMGPAVPSEPLIDAVPEDQVAKELSPEEVEQETLRLQRLAAEELAQQKLQEEQEALAKVEEARIAAEQAEAERVQAQRLADLKAVLEGIAIEETEKLLTRLPDEKADPVVLETEKSSEGDADKQLQEVVAETQETSETPETALDQVVATELKDLTVGEGRAVVETNGMVEKFKYFSLTNPPRLVVDLYNLEHSLTTNSIDIDDSFSQVRIGRHEDKTRLVFDANGTSLPETQVIQQSSEIVLTWDTPDVIANDKNADHEQAVAVIPAAQIEQKAVEQVEVERVVQEEIATLEIEEAPLAVEQLNAEKAEAERLEAERIAALEAEKQASERAEAERLEAERLAAQEAEKAKIAAQKGEADRLAVLAVAAQKAEAERAEAEKRAMEKAEAERLESERIALLEAEQKRIADEKLAARLAEEERWAAERAKAERLAAQKAEEERAAAEKLAAAELAAQQAEEERIAAMQAAAEKLEAERKAAERVAEVKVAEQNQARQDAATDKYLVADDSTATLMAANMVGSAGTSHQQGETNLTAGPVYGGIWGGALFPDSSDMNNLSLTADVDYDTGYGVGLLMGYDFGEWRLDVEGSYRTSSVDTLNVNSAPSTTSGGDLEVSALMINGYYDFEMPGDVSPYLGAGIGVARVSLDGYTSSGTLIVDDSDTVFAGQLSAGVLYALNEQVSLDLGYRYMMTGDAELNAPSGKLETDADNHLILVGVKFHF